MALLLAGERRHRSLQRCAHRRGAAAADGVWPAVRPRTGDRQQAAGDGQFDDPQPQWPGDYP
ncbi:hypothetical protein CQA78_30060, partial [Klebsiella pneumoniae]